MAPPPPATALPTVFLPDAGAKVLAIEGPTVYFNNGGSPGNIPVNVRSEPLSAGQLLGSVIGQPGVLQGFPGVAVADGVNPRLLAGVDASRRLQITNARTNVLLDTTIQANTIPQSTGNNPQAPNSFLVLPVPDFGVIYRSITVQALSSIPEVLTANACEIDLSRNLDGGSVFDSFTNSGLFVPIIRLEAASQVQLYDSTTRPYRRIQLRIRRIGATAYTGTLRLLIVNSIE